MCQFSVKWVDLKKKRFILKIFDTVGLVCSDKVDLNYHVIKIAALKQKHYFSSFFSQNRNRFLMQK